MINAKIVDAAVVTRPGSMKLWFRRYFPIRVLPVLSNDTAARTVPYVGKEERPVDGGVDAEEHRGRHPECDRHRHQRHDGGGLADQ